MAKRDKISMPQSGGGLIRYFDDFKSKVEIKPGHVIIIGILVIIIVLVLHVINPISG